MSLLTALSIDFYLGLSGVVHILKHLPWPDWRQYFGSIILFIGTYYPRLWIIKLINSRKNRPKQAEHGSASAAIIEQFHL